MLRIPIADLTHYIERALLHLGLAPERAALSARLIAETDRDGVRTHGIARLPRFAEMVHLGAVDPRATPETIASFGVLERWTGHRGPGNLAAHAAMARAIDLAKSHGLGAVALGNTSHWQRAGTYVWQAAEAGLAAICWTNTMPNLPPWGATTPALGNNPLVLAIPGPQPVVLDIAMSQFSYGALAAYSERRQQLPVPGGYDEAGNLTTDPAAIERTARALPIGFWKGSGLSFALDVLAATLAAGRATHQIPADPHLETGISQFFLAIAPSTLGPIEDIATGAIDALHAATPIDPASPVRYPGEATLHTREQNLRLGVPVDETQWQRILDLALSSKL